MSSKCTPSSGDALHAYVDMARASKGGETLVALIRQVLSADNVYVFGELLEVPSVAQLRNSSNPVEAGWYHVLTIFAYDRYNDYASHVDTLPPLNAHQRQKLRLLTLTSLAAQQRTLSYDCIRTELRLDDDTASGSSPARNGHAGGGGTHVRRLEDIVLMAIYNGLLKAQIDQRNGVVRVDWTMSRDLRPGAEHTLLQALTAWLQRCRETLQCIEEVTQSAKDRKAEDQRRWDAHCDRVTSLIQAIRIEEESKPPEARRSRATKRGGHHGSKRSRGMRLSASEFD